MGLTGIQKGWRFGFGLFGAYAAALAGAAASVHAREFYLTLDRPAWAPPGWLFGPVWTVLFTLMGLAAGLAACGPVEKDDGPVTTAQKGGTLEMQRHVRAAMALYVAQLLVNALWSWWFFAWRQGSAAFGDIVLLWILIASTIRAFAIIRPLAAALMLPYLAWVTFAAALCLVEWRMNPSQLGW